MRTFDVTIKVEGNADNTQRIMAADEWKARTKSMFLYPWKVRGKFVNYEVKEVTQ